MMLCSGLLEDVDLERKVVRRRGEHDKTGFEHETILTDAAVEALWEARRRPVVSPLVLPSPTDASRPGRHSLRRHFATELKHVPLKDLCALGRVEERADAPGLLPTAGRGDDATGALTLTPSNLGEVTVSYEMGCSGWDAGASRVYRRTISHLISRLPGLWIGRRLLTSS